MTIDFKIDIKTNFVQLSCQGVFSNAALFDVYERGLDIAASNGLQAILVDIRKLEGLPPTTMERYKHGEKVAKIQFNHDSQSCIALVGKEPIIDPQRFGETVALNRGAVGRVFTDIYDAVIWLENMTL